jgi:hypothetical protein
MALDAARNQLKPLYSYESTAEETIRLTRRIHLESLDA